MYRLCMIATIPLATGNKLNCFISASGMLAIVWHCVLLFCCFFCVCFLLIFYMLINHLLKKKKKMTMVSMGSYKIHIQDTRGFGVMFGVSNATTQE